MSNSTSKTQTKRNKNSARKRLLLLFLVRNGKEGKQKHDCPQMSTSWTSLLFSPGNTQDIKNVNEKLLLLLLLLAGKTGNSFLPVSRLLPVACCACSGGCGSIISVGICRQSNRTFFFCARTADGAVIGKGPPSPETLRSGRAGGAGRAGGGGGGGETLGAIRCQPASYLLIIASFFSLTAPLPYQYMSGDTLLVLPRKKLSQT